MQLSDGDLRIWMMDGKLGIEGFREENLTPNGYDLTIGEVLIPSKEKTRKRGSVRVPPHTQFLVSTVEYLRLGSKVTGDIWIRSSWARKGIMGSFGKVDAGFEGNLTLGAYNASEKEVEMSIGDTFAQLTFYELRTEPSMPYAERSGQYQGQRGVTLPRSSDRRRSGPGRESSS